MNYQVPPQPIDEKDPSSAGWSDWYTKVRYAINQSGLDFSALTGVPPNLVAISPLSGTGFASRTGTTTWSLRTFQAGAGISISNPAGIAGDPTFTNTGVTSIAGTALQITVSAATGAVTLSLPSAVTLPGSLTLTTDLTVPGIATFNGNTVIGNAVTDTVNFTATIQLAGSAGISGQILTSAGINATPTWTTLSGVAVTTFSAGTTGLTPSSATSGAITLAGTLIAANGGTGFASYAVGDLLYASTTTALSKLADVATGNALISGGVTTAPSWGKIGLTTHISGTLAPGNGGTGVVTVPTNGQLLVGNGTNYTVATLGTGTGISITAGAGTLQVNNTGVTSITGTANQITVSAATGGITLSLPSAITVPGSLIVTTTLNVTGTITSNSIFSSGTTGSGTGGNYRSVDDGGSTRWVSGILGSAGARAYSIYDNVRGVEVFSINGTTGAIIMAAPTSGTTLTLTAPNSGTILALGDGTVSAAIDFGGSRLNFGTISNHASGWFTNNLQRVLVAAAGNVTINAPAAGTALTVNAVTAITTNSIVTTGIVDIGGVRAFIGPTSSSSGNGGQIRLRKDTGVGSWLLGHDGGAGAVNFILYDLVGSAERLTVTPSGNFTLKSPSSGITATINGVSGNLAVNIIGSSSTGNSFGLAIDAGTNASDVSFVVRDTSGNEAFKIIGSLTASFGAPIITKGYTVATLPAGTLGMIAHVTDALAPTFLATVVGGGAVKSLVFYNGANWVAA